MSNTNNLIEVARSSVQSWECDQMGHMNVQFYVDRMEQGLAALAVQLGMGPRMARREGAQFAVRDLHVRFLREQHSGAPFYIRAGILNGRDDGLRVYLEMLNTVSSEAAATFVAEVDWLDVAERRPRALPQDVRAVTNHFQAELPAHGRPRGLTLDAPRPDPELEDADHLGMVRIWQGAVTQQQADAQGYLTTRHFMGIVADGIPNLLVQVEGRDRSKTPGLGGAALEYRFVYRRQPRVGDVLTLRSGLKELGEKTYVWCHWLFDLETGEAVATAEAVAIALDLNTRRAMPIPEAMRSHLAARVIAELGV
ncbi:MAG: thioesterase family protein [Gammaproteobacteria bacterium]|nr:thioesterase family protein [Gammaproteobacteria bacterium]